MRRIVERSRLVIRGERVGEIAPSFAGGRTSDRDGGANSCWWHASSNLVAGHPHRGITPQALCLQYGIMDYFSTVFSTSGFDGPTCFSCP